MIPFWKNRETPLETYPESVSDTRTTMGKESYKKVSTLCVLISFSGFVVGWDTAMIGGLLNMSDFKERFAEYDSATNEYTFSNLRTGLFSGFFALAAIGGCLLIPKLVSRIGKRQNIIVSCLIYLMGVCVFISSQRHWYQPFIARLILGFAMGGMSVLSPSLVAEMAPLEIRGTLLSAYQILSCFGIAFADIIVYGTDMIPNSSLQWRVPLIFSFVWQFIMLIALILAPESQSFLILQGKRHQAFKNLRKLYPTRSSDDLYLMLDDMTKDLDREQNYGISLHYMIFGKPKILYRILSGMLIQLFQGLTGITYFFYYSTTIFKGIGLDNSFVASMIIGAVYAISSFLAVPVTQRFQRKTVTLAGSLATFICLLAFTLLTNYALYPDPKDETVTSVIAGKFIIMVTSFYIFIYSITWGPMAYVIMNEIYPLSLNKVGVTFAMSANWSITFLVSFFTPFVTDKIGFKYGWVFVVATSIGFIYVLFGIPETKGLTYEQIDTVYEQNSCYFKINASSTDDSHVSKPTDIELPALKDKLQDFSQRHLELTDATPINDCTTVGPDEMDYFSNRP